MNQRTISPGSGQATLAGESQDGQSKVPTKDEEGSLPSKQGESKLGTTERPSGALPGSLYRPKSVSFWLIIICNFLPLYLVALDRTIVTTAIPHITDEFNSLGDIGWYGSAYMLASATSQLLYGRIYKFYHTKWVFLTTVSIFEIGSAICGAAPNSGTFIAGRAIAGLASAGIFTGCMLIMIPLIPLHKRPLFQSMFGTVFGLASITGPLIGGGFTSSIGWRYVCF